MAAGQLADQSSIVPAFTSFLTDLFETGHGRVPLVGHAEANFTSVRAQEILVERAQIIRLSAPCNAPELNMEAALEAAQWTFIACQLVVDRSHTTEVLTKALNESLLHESSSPSVVYSVDLCLSFLPDLVRHARQHAPDDPLMLLLKRMATDWPLSSVGIPDIVIAPEALNAWRTNDCLRQLYIDRILTQDDPSRLTDDRVMHGLRQSIGLHRDALVNERIRTTLSEQSM